MQEAHVDFKGCTIPHLEGEGVPLGYVGEVGRVGEILSPHPCGEERLMSFAPGSIR